MVTYKGTDKNMKCRGLQYELGVKQTDDGAIRCGDKGFHSCETPMDALSYYKPGEGNRYFECEASGTIDKRGADDSKIASSEIVLKSEIGLAGLIKAEIEYTKKTAAGRVAQSYRGHAAAQGDQGHAAAQGDQGHSVAQGYCGHSVAQGDQGHSAAQGNCGHSVAQGDYGHAAAQGDQGHAEVHGKDAIAASFGIEGVALGEIGDWLVLAEWAEGGGSWHILSVKSAFVDGETIKAGTWYKLVNGEFVEADEE